MKRAVLLAAVVLIVLAAGACLLFFREPFRGFEGETYVTIERGTGAVGIGRVLGQAGVVRFPWQFWAERAMHPSATLQAGEYRFDRGATVGDVFRRLARGDVYYFELTVPEGSNIFDIEHSLESAGSAAAVGFLDAASNPKLILDLDPSATTLEGYLFPSTYRLSHSTNAAELCRQMTEQFRKQWKKLTAGTKADAHRTVTLASMVEKETGVPAERPLVAAVFNNRLKKGMLLQCDPTTIYAALLDHRYRNAIHRSDLKSQNPYNTYQHPGLPPGPIASPGADSMMAALHPAETDYLYFVAKPEGGGHNFSTTLAGHEKATREYRKKARKAE